jgi:GNAT superfamily N-acetyltransferase
MIFEVLFASSKRGELTLVDGGLCHWHLRKDGQITIREIIVVPEKQGIGIASRMLEKLEKVKGATSIFAKCPTDLSIANRWYKAKGFDLAATEITRSGRELKHWRLELQK